MGCGAGQTEPGNFCKAGGYFPDLMIIAADRAKVRDDWTIPVGLH
jgi:hypothetical protein